LADLRTGRLADSIRILEDVPFQDMPEVFTEHDVCVLPASAEPYGSAPIEGMAYGCVPVLSDECGSAGIIRGKDCGYVVATGDVESLAGVFRKLIGHPGEVARLGANAAEVARRELGGALFVRKIEALADA
jgi:glycosyltransferase involved in cell wall biosynthesis